MHNFHLEFILSVYDTSAEIIKSSLTEFSEHLEICAITPDKPGESEDFKVKLLTEEPTVIFDLCAQLGKIKSVKIDEGKESF